MTSRRGLLTFVVVLSVSPSVRLSAQCPDGTPPPCRGARGPAANTIAVLPFENRARDSIHASTENLLSHGPIAHGRITQRPPPRR